MSWSQRFSVVLCIGFLSSIVVHGFFAILQPKTMVPSTCGSNIPTIARCDPYCHPQSLTDSRFAMALDAIKGKSRASATAIGSSSEQVKEMAAFLSVQLLEKVMNEAMKPGGESTMDIEAVERLTKALQMSSSEPSSETTTAMPETSMGVGKADDVDLGPAETAATTAAAITELASSSSPVTTETKTEDALVSTTDDDDISLDSTENPPIAALTTEVEEEKTVDPVPATENPPSTTPAAKVEETAKVVDPVPKKLVSPPKVPEVAWSPLEVVQSNIPPLRPESIPKKTTPVAEDVEPVADESAAEDESSSEDVAAEEPTISDSTTVEEIDEASDLDTKKAEESFHRRLLQQKLEFDKKEAARIKVEAEAKEETKEEEEEKPKG